MVVILNRAELTSLQREHDGNIRTDYSGRGMWGIECLGYTGPEAVLFAFDLANLIAERDVVEPDIDDVRQALVDLGDPKSDDIGTGTVWYWPTVQTEVQLADVGGEET